MSFIKSLNLTTIQRNAVVSPEKQRRNKLINHLREQLAIAKADADGSNYTVKKRRWELTEDGKKFLIEVDKRLKRWWVVNDDGSIVLGVKWGSKLMELDKGKTGIVLDSINSLIIVIDKLITAVDAGELDNNINAINKLRLAKSTKA
jgi:hypothetical protein